MTSRNNIFQTLPKETYQKILLDLKPKELSEICQTNIYTNKICNNYSIFWDNYIDKWYKPDKPTDYGYTNWKQVVNTVKPSNLFNFLNYLDNYTWGNYARIKIIISNIEYPMKFRKENFAFMKNNNLYQIKTRALIDDTVGDLLDRILRLYKVSPYKNNNIEYIRIICYDYGIIEYNSTDDKIIFYVLQYDEINQLTELDKNTKLNDVSFYNHGYHNNLFSSLIQFNRVIIKI